MEILNPKSQLDLFGYNKLFDSFITLNKKKKLPNVMLFSGAKGLGKATFAYHVINYLLSIGEDNKYLSENFRINPDNVSFKLLQNKHGTTGIIICIKMARNGVSMEYLL